MPHPDLTHLSDAPCRALSFILPAQAQKHVTHNEALTRLDLLTQLTVMAFGATQPPSLPAEGEIWALGPGASGAWAGHGGDLAAWIGESWQFITPAPGWRAASGGDLRIWTGSAWTALTAANLENVPGLGVNTGFDTTNRLSVSAPATLLSHEGADHQLKINKAAPGDTGSLLFQTDWSGRAEMGLAGSDDFAIKVSADGALWNDGLVVDAASGAVTMPNGASIDGVLTGSVVAQSSVDTTAGRIHINRTSGMFGLGATGVPPEINDKSSMEGEPAGIYRATGGSNDFLSAFETSPGVVFWGRFNTGNGAGILIEDREGESAYIIRERTNNNELPNSVELYHPTIFTRAR